MRFMLAFEYCFQRSGWFVNLLQLVVCQFIPYVGPVVMLGYCAEVAVILERDPHLRKIPALPVQAALLTIYPAVSGRF